VRAREETEAHAAETRAGASAVDVSVDGPTTGEIPRYRGPRPSPAGTTPAAAPPDGASDDGAPTAAEAAAGRRNAALVGAGILASRLAGLVREVAISAYLGVGLAADAFKAALRIPNLLQNLLGEGVLSASFIPVYARLLDEDDAEARRVAGAVFGLLATVAGLVSVLGVVFAEPITRTLTPGYEGDRLDLTVDLVRIMTPGIAVLVLSAWCLGVLNSHRHFFLSYVAPVLWNVAQIGVVVALGVSGAGDRTLAEGLAWGVTAGGVLQLLVQLPTVRRLGRGIRPSLDLRRPEVREVGRRFVPVLLGRGVVQLVGYVDLLLASLLVVGAVSAFTYAQVLYLLPISLFGMSVAAAELPELARLGRAGIGRMRARLDSGLGRIGFYVVGVQVVYLVAGDLVVGALLQRGDFGPDDTRLVWAVLAASSLALLATTGSRLLQNTLYALGDTRTPALVAVVRVLVAVTLGVVLMFQLERVVLDPGASGVSLTVEGDLPAPLEPLPREVRVDEDGPNRLGVVGLGLASSVGAWLELGLLRTALRRRVGTVRVGGPQRGRVFLGGLAAGMVLLALRPVTGGLGPLPAAVVGLVPGGLAYLAVTWLLDVDESRRLLGRVISRFRGRGPEAMQ
jgi:putative peptidoglycan lipid II flippase